jgi:acetyl-CoA carboxylase biotin carboxylase subunit
MTTHPIRSHSIIHRPFRSVLIANRGEIALRVVRTCRDLGIQPLAVYSEADVESMHVAAADGAYCLGAGPSSESYLRIDRILEAARALGAEAVHPGYGFLSENADFAQACFDAGLVWIGPSPESIRAMGDKTIAKRLVTAAGVPCSPGKNEPLSGLEELETIAADIGFPLILKAAAGGGGRGMKVIRKKDELKDAFEACQREALAYFANKDVFCERFVENPRHVEVQILGDSQGNIIHLYDRDCTVQRRHQKLFEEAPSSFISEETRQAMGAVAVKAASQVGYCSAGTVEFLLESPTQFYFMEMNTRVQVEHPVTEEITGVDIVAAQFRVARGEALAIKQSDVKIRGWACEARINAEDPYQGFRPSPGTIQRVRWPGGPGVRVDAHIYSGYTIPEFYDSMIAKLIAVGSDRNDALNKMARALGELEISGIETTIPFHQALVQHPVFREGHYTTKFLELHPDLMSHKKSAKLGAGAIETEDRALTLAIGAATAATVGPAYDGQAARAVTPVGGASAPNDTTNGTESPWAAAHRHEGSHHGAPWPVSLGKGGCP